MATAHRVGAGDNGIVWLRTQPECRDERDVGLEVRVARGVGRTGDPGHLERRPERIACIYADTPVMDLKSWPLGWPGAKRETADALKFYGFQKGSVDAHAFTHLDFAELGRIDEARAELRKVLKIGQPAGLMEDAQRYYDGLAARLP